LKKKKKTKKNAPSTKEEKEGGIESEKGHEN